ncbi:MAG: hypothetical protein ACLR7U_07340 [Ruthenibacterium lactatiformans]
MLSALLPGHELETGEISQKLGRGRHTTREVCFTKAAAPCGRHTGLASWRWSGPRTFRKKPGCVSRGGALLRPM